MSFNKAESLAATSGYFKWVADTSYHEAAAKARRPKSSGTSRRTRAVSGLDAAFLLAQARAMNDELGRANAELDADETAGGAALPAVAPRGGGDIFGDGRAKIRRGREARAAELRAGGQTRGGGRARNVRAVAHDAPFKPTEASRGGPFGTRPRRRGGLRVVQRREAQRVVRLEQAHDDEPAARPPHAPADRVNPQRHRP